MLTSAGKSERREEMDRLLYLMHIDWAWIKQRPHFLATELAAHFRVFVGHYKHYRRRNLVANARDARIAYETMARVPGRLEDWPGMARLNRQILSVQIRSMLRETGAEYVWIGSPVFYPALAGALGSRTLVYDCMDDCAGMGSARARERTLAAERALLQRADLVLISSQRLGDVMASRGYRGEPLLVNNAMSPALLKLAPPRRERTSSDPFVLLYFGTISHWFDFEGVLSVLDRFPEVRVRLAGPLEVALPVHPRLEYVGTVAHDALPALAAQSDVLMMPFVVNDLVRGVDPVKLYEYIAFRRNIIVPEYPEMRRFGAFVSAYRSTAELHRVVEEFLHDNSLRYAESDARSFLENHTWPSRAKLVVDALARVVRDRRDGGEAVGRR